MTSKIAAISSYRPRIETGNTVQKNELVRQLARATGLNESTSDLAFKEVRDMIIENLRAGRGVKIEGLGTWLPNIDLQGNFDVQYRIDPFLKNAINTPGTFVGTILNRENIGKTVEELIAMWNTDHPENPVSA